jgi:flagellar basal body-associated protein FliL
MATAPQHLRLATMRALIFILIVAIIVIIAAVATGFLNINQTREAKAPAVSATRNGVTAKGGEAPAFDVETGSVKVGSKETTVKVPAVVVQKPAQGQAVAATNNAQ